MAQLATARTTPGGNTIPGSNMPVAVGTLNPSMVTIQPGLTMWSPLGSSSGACFLGPTQGCGSAGWASSSFTMGTAGSYFLLFGVINWNDELFDSGLAIEGVTVTANRSTDRGSGASEPASSWHCHCATAAEAPPLREPFILIARKGHFRGTAKEVAFSLDDTMSSYLTSPGI
jgi:hypothetical protein